MAASGLASRSLLAVGARPHVDAIDDAECGVVGQKADDVASHPRKEFRVGDHPGPGGLAVLVEQKDEVDIGTANSAPDRRASPWRPRTTKRPASPLIEEGTPNSQFGAMPSQPNRTFDTRISQIREILRDQFERITAHDVVVPDAQGLALAKSPQGQALIVFIGKGATPWSQRFSIKDERSATLGASAHPIEQLGIADQDLAEVLARAENLQQCLCGPRVVGESAYGR